MEFKDLRGFIATLEKTGDLVRVKQEVDWDLEVGAITRRIRELSAPAAFFEKIKGYPPGYRILGIPVAGLRRVAVALGLSPEVSRQAIREAYQRRLMSPIKPVLVKSGPCKENIILGKEIDVCRFPAPMIHEGDGGRYIGSWHIIVAKDPDSDWTNWGMYRVMVHNSNQVGVLLAGNQGGKIFYEKYARTNQPMPVAIAIGTDPISSLLAATTFPAGHSEVDWAGALRGEPVELVKCETSDLLVPAYAEIVLEGEMLPGVLMPEGPFGEFTGYRTPWKWREVCRIKAITHRNDPILTMYNPGMPGIRDQSGSALFNEVGLKRLLQERGVPVTDVHIPPMGADTLVIVGIKRTTQSNMAVKAKNVVRSDADRYEKIIVVDEDVDVFNLTEVLHAFATRCHPARKVIKDEQDTCHMLAPYLTAEETRWGEGASVLLDSTWPATWSTEMDIPPRVSFNEVYPQEMKEKVVKNWKSYGFK